MACPDADTVNALVTDALTEARRAAIAEHAAGCARCHALLAALIDEGQTAPSDETFDARGSTTARLLPHGMRIGRYEIDSRLGAGGMGVVYAAVDTELHRRVAIKVLRGHIEDRLGTQGRDRLLREARTLASLSHPNVVTVYDIGTHDGDLFLAMELVDGGSLTRWLREPHAPGDVLERMIEAGRGLAAAHAAGVVHRDVKPDNILVGSDGRARMTDFGLARSLDHGGADGSAPTTAPGTDLTRTGALMGTPAYMAPEQMTGGAIDARTDQWAFCATLYEALAGVRPVPADDAAGRIAAITAGRFAPPAPGRALPGWLRPIVARGLRRDPAERWPDMASVVAALIRGRRRGRVIAAIAVATVVAVGLVALGTRLFGRDPAPPHRMGTFTIAAPNVYADSRGPACDCPFSACTDRCASSCRARGYQYSSLVVGIANNAQQDILLGASADGATILYLSGTGCAVNRLLVARLRGDRYESIDLTDQLDPRQIELGEGCCTLTADGAGVIAAGPGLRSFVRMGLDGDRLGPPEPAEFAALARDTPGFIRFAVPVMSHDQRTIYLQVFTDHDGDLGPTIDVAERADPRAPFAPARPLEGIAQKYDYVTGVTADNLTLFVAFEYGTHVLVRSRTTEPFGVGEPSWIPPKLNGWRVVPVNGCERLLGTFTPGGCQGEDIAWIHGLDRP